MTQNLYEWTDNPTVSGSSVCDTDVLNDDLMHLKYDLPEEIKKIEVNSLSSSGTIELTDNSVNKIEPTGAVTFVLPTINENERNVFHQILVQMSFDEIQTIDLGTSYFFNCTAPDLSEAGIYNLVYEHDAQNEVWVVGVISKSSEG